MVIKMLKQELNIILNDLNKRNRSKSKMLEQFVSNRLDASLNTYYSELLESYEFLKSRNQLKLAKKINRRL